MPISIAVPQPLLFVLGLIRCQPPQRRLEQLNNKEDPRELAEAVGKLLGKMLSCGVSTMSRQNAGVAGDYLIDPVLASKHHR